MVTKLIHAVYFFLSFAFMKFTLLDLIDEVNSVIPDHRNKRIFLSLYKILNYLLYSIKEKHANHTQKKKR